MQINPLDYAGLAWWRMAVLYFVAGVSLGIGMGVSGDHKLFGVHAHVNLTGWVSLALIGLIYQHLPELGRKQRGAHAVLDPQPRAAGDDDRTGGANLRLSEAASPARRRRICGRDFRAAVRLQHAVQPAHLINLQ